MWIFKKRPGNEWEGDIFLCYMHSHMGCMYLINIFSCFHLCLLKFYISLKIFQSNCPFLSKSLKASFRMNWSTKASIYNYGLTHESHGDCKSKAYNTYTHTHKRKEQKLTSRESHQTTREETTKKKRWTEKNYQNNQKTSSKMAVSTYLSIITLNVNGPNSLIKRHRVADCIKTKQDSSICCLQ